MMLNDDNNHSDSRLPQGPQAYASGRSIGESGGVVDGRGNNDAKLANLSRRKLIQKTNTVHNNNINHTSLDGNTTSSSAPLLRGFVDGDFSNGIRHFIDTGSKCFAVTSCQNLIVIGTETCLTFNDAQTFTEIHKMPVQTMISALRIIELPTAVERKNHFLLATADLSATIRLYEIDIDILESQGPTLKYTTNTRTQRQRQREEEYPQKQQPAQIRCVDLVLCEFSNGKHSSEIRLVLVAGDTLGRLRIVDFAATSRYATGIDTTSTTTMSLQFTPLSSQCIEYNDDKILSVSLQKHGYLAISFRSGWIRVVELALLLLARSVGIRHEDTTTASLSTTNITTVFEVCRQGPVRCVRWFNDHYLAAGGYDKCVVIFDRSQQFVMSRILHLQGTVNTIEMDPRGRYVGVGCRDKTLTIYDTSTYHGVKTFYTPSWVTSISWINHDVSPHTVAVRTEPTRIAILDLSPIHMTSISMVSGNTTTLSAAWSRCSRYLARVVDGSKVIVSNTSLFLESFNSEIATLRIPNREAIIAQVAFGPKTEIATVDDSGNLTIWAFLESNDDYNGGSDHNDCARWMLVQTAHVEPHLKALAWSKDGKHLVTGGRGKHLYIFSFSDGLKLATESPIRFQGRIWDIDFITSFDTGMSSNEDPFQSRLYLAVALGDYTTWILDDSFEPLLRITRSLTCRCLRFHPNKPLLAIGDGNGTFSIVDYDSGELVVERQLDGRVEELDFSPLGDYIVVAIDSNRFEFYETSTYQAVQQIHMSAGIPQCVSFAPNGLFLLLGSTVEQYSIVKLGPFLGTAFIPLTVEVVADNQISLPNWVLSEALYRSCDSPSFLQRIMAMDGSECLRNVSYILRHHPKAFYTIDRRTGESCFDTALSLKKPRLVKLIMVCLVNGTLDPASDQEKNFVSTNIPYQARDSLVDIAMIYPPEFIVEIFNEMTFMRVPCTGPRAVKTGDRLERGNNSYTDPWSKSHESVNKIEQRLSSVKMVKQDGMMRTPAVLPLPGLGDMGLLACLLASAPPEVFDADAMGIVLRVLWHDHIRIYYHIDCILFVIYYGCWVALIERTLAWEEGFFSSQNMMMYVVTCFNTLFTLKELMEGRYGTRKNYWHSIWNYFDTISMILVYAFVAEIAFTGDVLPPLGVAATLFLTIKLLSYLRGFKDTGWLISVLTANFRDVKGFLIILFSILVGFAVAFRLLFGDTENENFGSLRRSFLSTFELTVTGSYDPDFLFESKYSIVASLTFILAITCVLVVALNALISILADSYARVQEKAIANRRREQAALIVEYMRLLPPWKRQKIEKEARWFHTLLEVDADGSLQLQKDDWEGGLNALRRDLEKFTLSQRRMYEKSLVNMKTELDAELSDFRKEVLTVLDDLQEDIKYIRSHGIMNIDPKKNVVMAVKAVQSIGRKGGALFNSPKK